MRLLCRALLGFVEWALIVCEMWHKAMGSGDAAARCRLKNIKRPVTLGLNRPADASRRWRHGGARRTWRHHGNATAARWATLSGAVAASAEDVKTKEALMRIVNNARGEKRCEGVESMKQSHEKSRRQGEKWREGDSQAGKVTWRRVMWM